MKKGKKKIAFQAFFLLLLIIGTVYVIGQQQTMPYQQNTGFIFGTVYNITYQSDEDLQKDIEAELNKVDNSLSTFNKNSVISKINRNEDVQADKMFTSVFHLAEQISKNTEGAFDITVAPLVNVWGFGFKKGVNPTEHTIDSLLQITGYENVSLVNSRIQKKDSRIMLDCSAIAKGYGCDVVAALLQSKGISNYMVEIGGEVVTAGKNAKQAPWRIGITKPSEDSLGTSKEMQAVISITDKAMATSGNYRNFYYKGGKRYAHTIDPTTGYPVQHNILSATVIAHNCATADAYATAFMVMGLDKAKTILDKHPEIMAYFICAGDDDTNTVWCSPKLKEKIQE